MHLLLSFCFYRHWEFKDPHFMLTICEHIVAYENQPIATETVQILHYFIPVLIFFTQITINWLGESLINSYVDLWWDDLGWVPVAHHSTTPLFSRTRVKNRRWKKALIGPDKDILLKQQQRSSSDKHMKQRFILCFSSGRYFQPLPRKQSFSTIVVSLEGKCCK